MKVCEVFFSIQGEGLSSGFPTVFVRFAGCNLRCSYCDTVYAYSEAYDEYSPKEVFEKIRGYCCMRVCITGGEPLLQSDLNDLLILLDGYKVSIETNGTLDIGKIRRFREHSFVMDAKTPSSGFSGELLRSNFDLLDASDEIKFVIGCREDYDWAKQIISSCVKSGTVTISPVFGLLKPGIIVGWILEDRLDVRFQLQLHKAIWGAEKRGV